MKLKQTSLLKSLALAFTLSTSYFASAGELLAFEKVLLEEEKAANAAYDLAVDKTEKFNDSIESIADSLDSLSNAMTRQKQKLIEADQKGGKNRAPTIERSILTTVQEAIRYGDDILEENVQLENSYVELDNALNHAIENLAKHEIIYENLINEAKASKVLSEESKQDVISANQASQKIIVTLLQAFEVRRTEINDYAAAMTERVEHIRLTLKTLLATNKTIVLSDRLDLTLQTLSKIQETIQIDQEYFSQIQVRVKEIGNEIESKNIGFEMPEVAAK